MVKECIRLLCSSLSQHHVKGKVVRRNNRKRRIYYVLKNDIQKKAEDLIINEPLPSSEF